MSARVVEAIECDHMRPIVYVDGEWRHVNAGIVGAPCIAGAYRVSATYEGEHYLNRLVLDSELPVGAAEAAGA